jgi:cytochrome c peroxidase
MKNIYRFISLAAFLVLSILTLGFISGCDDKDTVAGIAEDEINYHQVPEDFPPIPFPADNPFSHDKAELGRRLFYEKILSRDSTISCSHCMKPEHGFSDPVPTSRGWNGESQNRNSMSVVNSAYRELLNWDGRGSRIETNAYRSFFLRNVFGSDTNEINTRLQNSPLYRKLFKLAFGNDAQPNCYDASRAIATFARTLVSGNSRYDKYNRGNKGALNATEIRGMKLFFSDRTKCSVCHSGFLFTDMKFHNTGTTTHYFDRGRFYVTGNMEDRGKFLTPSLRNVELTGPYLHEGNFKTLEEIVDNYNLGGKAFITKDTLIKPLNLTDQEKTDLVAFLKSLTDWDFIHSRKISNPALNY